MLYCLFVTSIEDYKAGGFGRIIEVDEALVENTNKILEKNM